MDDPDDLECLLEGAPAEPEAEQPGTNENKQPEAEDPGDLTGEIEELARKIEEQIVATEPGDLLGVVFRRWWVLVTPRATVGMRRATAVRSTVRSTSAPASKPQIPAVMR